MLNATNITVIGIICYLLNLTEYNGTNKQMYKYVFPSKFFLITSSNYLYLIKVKDVIRISSYRLMIQDTL